MPAFHYVKLMIVMVEIFRFFHYNFIVNPQFFLKFGLILTLPFSGHLESTIILAYC